VLSVQSKNKIINHLVLLWCYNDVCYTFCVAGVFHISTFYIVYMALRVTRTATTNRTILDIVLLTFDRWHAVTLKNKIIVRIARILAFYISLSSLMFWVEANRIFGIFSFVLRLHSTWSFHCREFSGLTYFYDYKNVRV